MGDAHVDYSLDPCSSGCVEQTPGVGHGQVVVDPVVGEADPVGVVEGGGTLEGFDEPELIVEIERTDVDGRAIGGPTRVPGDRPDMAAPFEKGAGDGSARIAEGT